MADTGDVRFAVDLSAGLVYVTVRPPLTLEGGAATAAVSVLSFLDCAAQTLLEMNQQQREAMASLGRGRIAEQIGAPNGVAS